MAAPTREQLIENIKAMEAQGAPQGDIQAYLDQFKGQKQQTMQTQTKEPGPLARFGQSVAKPFISALAGPVTLLQAGQDVLTGKSDQAAQRLQNLPEVDFGPFGKAKPVTTPQQMFGTGAEIASYYPGAGAVKSLGTGLLKGKILPALKSAVPAATASGALAGGGRSLAEGDSFGQVAGKTALGAGIGAVGGAVLAPVGALAGVGARSAYNAIRKQSAIARGETDKIVDDLIDTSIEKAIRPSVAGKKTLGQATKYKNQSREAVKTIVENKDNINLTDEFGDVSPGLPKTLKQFQESIDQVKKKIFGEYDSLKTQAGDQGAVVELSPLVKELATLRGNKALQDIRPGTISYINSQIQKFSKRGAEAGDSLGMFQSVPPKYTAQEAQDAIKILNESLEAFYKNPSSDTAARASVDALIANNLRKGLDESIEKAIGPGYQALKNKYGALSAIEKDVAHRSVVEGRRANKGLIDFSDIFSAGDVVSGILSQNAGLIAKGAIQKGVASYFKFLNNPNKIIEKMFGEVDNLYKPGAKAAPKGPTPTPRFNGPQGGTPNPKGQIQSSIEKAKSAGVSFDEWVRGQGSPLYHGTNADFEVFDKTKIGSATDDGLFGRGFYFGNTESFARGAPRGRLAKNVMEVYSPSANLFDISKIKSKKAMADLLNMSEDALMQDSDGIIRPVMSQIGQFTSHVQDLGYDGVVVKRGGDAIETVIFEPEKLKTRSQLKAEWDSAK